MFTLFIPMYIIYWYKVFHVNGFFLVREPAEGVALAEALAGVVLAEALAEALAEPYGEALAPVSGDASRVSVAKSNRFLFTILCRGTLAFNKFLRKISAPNSRLSDSTFTRKLINQIFNV